MQITLIDGGIAAPEGFFASGISCGIKPNGAKDLALVCSDDTAAAAGVFSSNKVKSNSLKLTMKNIANGYANAIVINSGNANACNGEQGYVNAEEICALVARELSCEPDDVLIASTGPMGEDLPMDSIRESVPTLVAEMSDDGNLNALDAIMTFDKRRKEFAAQFELQGKDVKIGIMAKGSGLTFPKMGNMLAVITTDVNISKRLLQSALENATALTFDKISVDGVSGVTESVIAFANGQADNSGLVETDAAYDKFCSVLRYLCNQVSKEIVRDSENAKFLELNVKNAASPEDALSALNCIARSQSFKADIAEEYVAFGSILTSLGQSEASFNPSMVDVYLGDVMICRAGSAVSYDEAAAAEIISKNDISITLDLNNGSNKDKLWCCAY